MGKKWKKFYLQIKIILRPPTYTAIQKFTVYSRDPQIWTTPAEFSSNPNQTHLSMLIKVFKIIRKSQVVSLMRVGAKLCSKLDLQGKIWGTLVYSLTVLVLLKSLLFSSEQKYSKKQ